MDITILPMSQGDIDEVLKIEDVSFPRPWSRAQFEKELENPFSRSFAARLDKSNNKALVGYIIIWLVAEEAHILNIAVHPDFKKKGIGAKLIRFILDFLAEQYARAVYLEVRHSNTAAQMLYKGFGFKEIGIRKGYYSDNNEDAIVMGLEMKDKNRADR